MRATLIAELASGHGGDLDLAKDLISVAADNGWDIVKTQAFQVKHLSPQDPQYAWFQQSELSPEAHLVLMEHAKACGVEYLTTAFHPEDLALVKALGLTSVKIGSGEGRTNLVKLAQESFKTVYATLPWGSGASVKGPIYFGTVPLYPAPPECFSQVKPRDGYSDHHVGIDVAKIALAQGVQFLEKHLQISGRGRQCEWNATPGQLKELRRWAEVCTQARNGTRFENRWNARA